MSYMTLNVADWDFRHVSQWASAYGFTERSTNHVITLYQLCGMDLVDGTIENHEQFGVTIKLAIKMYYRRIEQLKIRHSEEVLKKHKKPSTTSSDEDGADSCSNSDCDDYEEEENEEEASHAKK
jgi:hypothetical protein